MTTLVLIFLLALAYLGWRRYLSFSSQRPSDYAETLPAFDVRTHLNGPLLSEGVIYGPTGKVVSRFVAKMHGTWEGNRGRLTEEFTYSSGDTQNRAWELEIGNDGEIRAKAEDIIGTGTGKQSGSAVQMKYRIKLAEDAGGHVLNVTDWMYLTDNGVIMNRSEMRKYGLKVAELVATIRPEAA
ncbi:DUF3833 domain-containing protein [Actibacterium pelagium]|uniref:DUF3833 domain-containing protein n=1 Tax=Actibacterium pelagium TaxID=2029103 RepID=A0A917EIH0_9RHOB|nr:DUF3833 domain-containing protein [Actibacterium pelagium]GGE38714.1 hypothetical protein GCM10011517_03130 [Actibacterium pelagium]